MNRMAAERKKRGWTRSYVAVQLKITERALYNLEHGRSAPRYNTAESLRALYGLPAHILMAPYDDTASGEEKEENFR